MVFNINSHSLLIQIRKLYGQLNGCVHKHSQLDGLDDSVLESTVTKCFSVLFSTNNQSQINRTQPSHEARTGRREKFTRYLSHSNQKQNQGKLCGGGEKTDDLIMHE